MRGRSGWWPGRAGLRLLCVGMMLGQLSLAGCDGMQPAATPIQPAPAMQVRTRSDTDRLLRFASWIEGASPGALQRKHGSLQLELATHDDDIALLMLSMLLHEPRTPDADPGQALRLVTRFLQSPEQPSEIAVRDLAALMLRSWSADESLKEALRAAQRTSRQASAALEKERHHRTLAEERLDALIKLERRVQHVNGPDSELQPTSR